MHLPLVQGPASLDGAWLWDDSCVLVSLWDSHSSQGIFFPWRGWKAPESRNTEDAGPGLRISSHTHIPPDKAKNVLKLHTHGAGQPICPIKVEGRE